MIKHTLEISQQPLHVRTEHDQLVLLGRDEAGHRVERARFSCEDVGILLVENPGASFTQAALERLLTHGAAVVICGRDHLPAGMLLPVGEHSEVVPRIGLQIAVRRPLRKRLWRQIVQAKLRAQAANLAPGSASRARLLALARQVRSGDTTNVEAQAARAYWPAWRDSILIQPPCSVRDVRSEGLAPRTPPGAGRGEGAPWADAVPPITPAFHRDPDGPPPNNLLNYGYAVLRAAVARAIVAAGLVPALGIQHRHRANAFCLADDLLEPLRPLVDDRVRELVRHGHTALVPAAKAGLLELLTLTVRVGDGTGPLMVALHRMVASLVACYAGESEELHIPVPEDAA